MDPRQEIDRLLQAAGEPPTSPDDLGRGVWAEIERERRSDRRTQWSWLPRGWEVACVVLCAFGLGVISAEWRLQHDDGAARDEHRRYLATIDPTRPAAHKP